MSKLNVAALALSGALLAGCGEQGSENPRSGAERVGETTCNLSSNLLSNDPRNPNSQVFHPMWLAYPIITDCSTDLTWASRAQAKILYTRSTSLSKPTTWDTRSSDIRSTQDGITHFARVMNRKTTIWENVKPYIAPAKNTTITIKSGSVVGNTSAEGRKEGGDLSLIEANAVGNTVIATKRAGDIRDQIMEALVKTWASVRGAENIRTLAKVNPLSEQEMGLLYVEALRAHGNGTNRTMERIAEYNAWTATSPNLDTIIGNKRFAEATIEYTATGVDRTVDISKWNYALWALVAGLLASGWIALTRKNKRR